MRTWLTLALLAGLSGCSLTNDFDRPFPEDDVNTRCQTFCDEAVGCIKRLTNQAQLDCNFGNQPADLALFRGHCEVVCRAQPGSIDLRCDNGNDNYERFWRTNAAYGFEGLCDVDTALCDFVCEPDGLTTPLADWSGELTYRVPEVCSRGCREREAARWQCVGEQQALSSADPEELDALFGDFAANPERCESNPSR